MSKVNLSFTVIILSNSVTSFIIYEIICRVGFAHLVGPASGKHFGSFHQNTNRCSVREGITDDKEAVIFQPYIVGCTAVRFGVSADRRISGQCDVTCSPDTAAAFTGPVLLDDSPGQGAGGTANIHTSGGSLTGIADDRTCSHRVCTCCVYTATTAAGRIADDRAAMLIERSAAHYIHAAVRTAGNVTACKGIVS